MRYEMTFHSSEVMPVFRPSVRSLCRQRYPNHPHGCPNYGKRPTCPPDCRLYPEIINTQLPVWFLWAEFPFGEHVKWMQTMHPTWSKRQLECCIYWQHTVRKFLRKHADTFQNRYVAEHPEINRRVLLLECPEAMGINVTATMENIGVHLEWPPKYVTRMVYLMGVSR